MDEIKEFTALEETTGRPYNQVLLNMYSGGDPLGFGIGKNLWIRELLPKLCLLHKHINWQILVLLTSSRTLSLWVLSQAATIISCRVTFIWKSRNQQFAIVSSVVINFGKKHFCQIYEITKLFLFQSAQFEKTKR